MHTLFTLEDNYGLKITEQDGELALQVDFRKTRMPARLHEMLWAWREQAAKLRPVRSLRRTTTAGVTTTQSTTATRSALRCRRRV